MNVAKAGAGPPVVVELKGGNFKLRHMIKNMRHTRTRIHSACANLSMKKNGGKRHTTCQNEFLWSQHPKRRFVHHMSKPNHAFSASLWFHGHLVLAFGPNFGTQTQPDDQTKHSHIRWSWVVIKQIRTFGLADILGADKFGKESEFTRLEPRQEKDQWTTSPLCRNERDSRGPSSKFEGKIKRVKFVREFHTYTHHSRT